jgi:DNA-binding MarR family transcriptional regulator
LKIWVYQSTLIIVPEPLDARTVAAALQVSISVFVRRLRQTPVPGALPLPEIAALSRLEQAGSTTASELARAEQITPQAVGVTLAGLERRGLVRRRPDPSDGRRVVMSVTAAGRAALRSKHNARTEQLAGVLTGRFTDAEIRTLLAAAPLIERLAEGL